jgi:hypothetical protein
MPKSKHMAVKRPKLSQDALFFLHKMFGGETERLRAVNIRGKRLTPRAIESVNELVEAKFMHASVDRGNFLLIKEFPDPPFKLQRIRELYDAFDIFEPPFDPTGEQALKADIALHSNPLIETMTDLSRVQTDLLCALRYADNQDPIAQLHVRHAIQAIQRLATESVKSLETMLQRAN